MTYNKTNPIHPHLPHKQRLHNQMCSLCVTVKQLLVECRHYIKSLHLSIIWQDMMAKKPKILRRNKLR